MRHTAHKQNESEPGEEPIGGIGRRAVLTGGLVGVGGLAAFLAAEPAEAVSAGNVIYGPAPTGGDDTSSLQSAINALAVTTGTLILPPTGSTPYQITSTVTVPTGVSVVGSGGGFQGPSTVIQCCLINPTTHVKSGDGRLEFQGGGGVSGSFVLDGSSQATLPLFRSNVGTAVGRVFLHIGVLSSAQDGVHCYGAQNDAWYYLAVSGAVRDCLVLDQGVGGCLFSKCEITGAGNYNLRLDQAVGSGPYPGPSDNLFHHCLFERNLTPGTPNQALASIQGGSRIKFDHCGFYATDKPAQGVIRILGVQNGLPLTTISSEIVFEDCYIASGSSPSGDGLVVDVGCSAAIAGLTHFQFFTNAIHIAKLSTATTPAQSVDIQGTALYFNCTNFVTVDSLIAITTMGVEAFVHHKADTVPIRSYRSGAEGGGNALTYVSTITTAPYYTVTENALGYRAYGNGTAAPDVHFGRQGVASVGVASGEFLVVGYGTTALRPPPGPPLPTGALRFNTTTNKLEVNNGTAWV